MLRIACYILFYFLQGEGGKPGERGVMGAIGVPVSIYITEINSFYNLSQLDFFSLS